MIPAATRCWTRRPAFSRVWSPSRGEGVCAGVVAGVVETSAVPAGPGPDAFSRAVETWSWRCCVAPAHRPARRAGGSSPASARSSQNSDARTIGAASFGPRDPESVTPNSMRRRVDRGICSRLLRRWPGIDDNRMILPTLARLRMSSSLCRPTRRCCPGFRGPPTGCRCSRLRRSRWRDAPRGLLVRLATIRRCSIPPSATAWCGAPEWPSRCCASLGSSKRA